MSKAKKDYRKWAKEGIRGFENILMPSFTPDLGALDPAGIRLDVRRSIEHGFFSVFAVPLGLNREERREFFRICTDEAAGRIKVGSPLIAPDEASQHAYLDDCAEMKLSHVLAHPWHTWRPDTADDLYSFYRGVSDYTDLAVELWATDGWQCQHLHPSNVVVDVYDRVADLPNVVAVKLMTTLDLPVVYELCERLSDRLLVAGVHLGIAPLLVKHYGMQWSGAWTVEALQSPEQRNVVDYLNLLVEGRDKEALAIYWKIKPAYDALYALMAPMLPKGVHPFTHLKYYQWCMGGNGGLLREAEDPNEREFPLRPDERAHIRKGYQSIGLSPTADPDEVFVVGRAAWKSGARAADMPVKHTYTV
ncbi:MAG: dihydrodipicolinate synthase family protein [Gammaproteobacteria bacterium]|nr:dihydrodipicolinate synthase family protein [Gammaproteobacteria bacterium]